MLIVIKALYVVTKNEKLEIEKNNCESLIANNMKIKNKCEFVMNCHLFDAIDLHKTIFVVNQLQIKLHK